MKKYIPTFTVAALAAAIVIGSAVSATAQSTNAAAASTTATKPAKKEAPAKGSATKPKDARAVPFKGSVGAVDRTAMTIKVGERTFQVTSSTRILKAGKPATFSDATVGEECAGSYKKTADDKLELLSLRIGAKADGAAAPAAPAAPVEPKDKPAAQ